MSMQTKVLIADDEYIERRGLASLFARLSFPAQIFEAENGRDALTLLLREKPKILLTDIKMPGTDGIMLLRQAKAALPDLITVIITAYGEFTYARDAIELGVSRYLLKPVDPQEFECVMKGVFAAAGPNEASLLPDTDNLDPESDKSSSAPLSSADYVISEVLRILRQEYMFDLSVETIAARVFLTPSYLSYLFKKQTGQTLSKYLTELRLDRAQELLSGTNRKIADVSNAVGYPNISYFCVLFKNRFGVTPSQFKRSR